MFLGHFAVALAAKKVEPRVSLATYVLAGQFLDVLWPVFLLAGVERVAVDPGNTVVTPFDFLHYPFSHSLLMAALWAFLFAGGHFLLRRNAKAAGLLAALVLSHWLLDYVTHRPDLPLYPGGPKLGLGLWNSLYGTLAAELGLFLAGIFLYENATKPVDRTGSRNLALFSLVLIITYLGNVFGPPPPDDSRTLAFVGLAMWILFVWAWWFDRHRVPR